MISPRLTDADLLRADRLHGNHADWCDIWAKKGAALCTCGSWEFGVMYADMLFELRAARLVLRRIATAEGYLAWRREQGAEVGEQTRDTDFYIWAARLIADALPPATPPEVTP